MVANSESRICQNCKGSFVIDVQDFGFYEKIKVPPPTFCPECRFYRRLAWRNDWHVFKKKDALTGKEIFSLFPEESPVKIFEKEYWLSDAWDSMDYGRDYDFSKTFFEQFRDLHQTVPIAAHSIHNLTNCQYCANANNMKNCYFVRAATFTEDSAYLVWDHASRFSFDSHMTIRCELSYGNLNTINCYKTFFSVDLEDCQEMILCADCVGSNNCFGSFGLRNKSYHIFNEPYSKEEYFKKIKELNFGSYESLVALQKKAFEHWQRYPHKYMHGRRNSSVSGDYIYNSKNAKDCFRTREVEDVKWCQNILQGAVNNCYDYTNWGQNAELMYETLVAGDNVSMIKFCSQVWPNVKSLEYCIFCQNSSDLFGCVSLRNKQYCIFNKQYSKEDYFKLREKIIKQMNEMPYISAGGQEYRYGEFFPAEFSPFPYQVSAAYEFIPLSEEEAKEKGYAAYSVEKPDYKTTIKADDLLDQIQDVKNDILNEVIECAHASRGCLHECTRAFRIVDRELDFCKRMEIPLPRLCVNCRYFERLIFRNPPILYRRECDCSGKKSKNNIYQNTAGHFHGEGRCLNEFETSYSPERPEIVYCEQCYQTEVA